MVLNRVGLFSLCCILLIEDMKLVFCSVVMVVIVVNMVVVLRVWMGVELVVGSDKIVVLKVLVNEVLFG